MKILLYGLNYAPEPVGIGKYTGELAQWFSAQGHQIRVITAPPYFPAWRVSSGFRNVYSIDTYEGMKVYRCPLWVPRRPRGMTRLLHLASFALSSFGPLLAFHGKRIGRIAAEAKLGGNDICANALRHKILIKGE